MGGSEDFILVPNSSQNTAHGGYCHPPRIYMRQQTYQCQIWMCHHEGAGLPVQQRHQQKAALEKDQ